MIRGFEFRRMITQPVQAHWHGDTPYARVADRRTAHYQQYPSPIVAGGGPTEVGADM